MLSQNLNAEQTAKREQATQAILRILDDFAPDEWDELIGENSYVMAVKRGKIEEQRIELVAPLMKRMFDVD